MPAQPALDRHPVEHEVAAVRELLQGASDRLARMPVPPQAALFARDIEEARHHLGIAKLKLSNALSTRLPRSGR
jgi:hypothetical protein